MNTSKDTRERIKEILIFGIGVYDPQIDDKVYDVVEVFKEYIEKTVPKVDKISYEALYVAHEHIKSLLLEGLEKENRVAPSVNGGTCNKCGEKNIEIVGMNIHKCKENL